MWFYIILGCGLAIVASVLVICLACNASVQDENLADSNPPYND